MRIKNYILIFLVFTAEAKKDVDTFKNDLCEYAIKELVENYHQEREARVSQERKKWIAIGIGVITTLIPLITTIIQISTVECKCSVDNDPVDNSSTASLWFKMSF